MLNHASAEIMRLRPSQKLESSSDYDWASTLLERHYVAGGSRTIISAPLDDTHIAIILTGHLRLEVNKRHEWETTAASAGGLVLTPGGQGEHLRSFNSSPVEVAHLFIPNGLILDAADEIWRVRLPTTKPLLGGFAGHDPLILAAVNEMLWAMRSGASELYAERTLAWLTMHILARHAGESRRFNSSIHNLTAARLSRTVEMVHARLAEDLSLSVLAAEAGVSRFHFARLFREKTGKPPHAYVESVRMAKAQQLLRETDLHIATIAADCGYSRPVQFGVVFKRNFGVTPTQYRERGNAR